MEFLTSISIQLLLLLIGFPFGIIFGVKNRIEIIGLSYLLGSGLVSIVFLIFHWVFQIPLNQTLFFLTTLSTVSTGFIIIFLVTTLFKRLSNLTAPIQLASNVKNNRIIIFNIFVISISILFSAYENYFWPIIDWDAIALYDFRAQVLHKTESFVQGIELGYFFQYPPYTSFLHLFGYLFDTSRVKLAYTALYFAFLCTFYGVLRRKQSLIVSSITTVLLATSPLIFEHSVMAYSNLPYTAYYALGTIYLWMYYKQAALSDLLVGTILIAISSFIRSTEPFWIASGVIIVLSYFKHRKHLFFTIFMLPLLNLPDRIWRLFLTSLADQSSVQISETKTHAITATMDFINQQPSIFQVLVRIFQVSWYLTHVLTGHFFLLLLLFILTSYGYPKNKYIIFITFSVICGIILAGTLVFSFTFDTWNMIEGSIIRMCMIFVPLLLYASACDLEYEKK